MSITAMKQALSAWDAYKNASDSREDAEAYASLAAAFGNLRAACERAEKPVAHVYRMEANGRPVIAWDDARDIEVGAKLYAAPRPWVNLTDEQINQYDYEYRDLLYDAEKMLRENNA